MDLRYVVKEHDCYTNVKEVLKAYFHISDRLLLKLKNSKNIFLNGEPTYVSKSIKTNDVIIVRIDFIEDSSNIVPVKMDLNILYEDEYYLVINKPPHLPVHPSMLHYENSLSNGVKYYFDSIGLKKKIRPVIRLDKDTSGIVIFAKNEYIQESLIKQMKEKIEKLTSIGKMPQDIYLNPSVLTKYDLNGLNNAIDVLKQSGLDAKNVPLIAY